MSESAGYIIIAGLMALLLVWTFYMVTFRTDDFLRLARYEEERRKARHHRMSRAAGGAFKAGMTAFRIFRR